MIGPIIGEVSSRVSSPVLIGRSAELGRLRAALALAQDGEQLGRPHRRRGRRRQDPARHGVRRVGAKPTASSSCSVAASTWARARCRTRPIVEALRGLVRRLDPAELERLIGQVVRSSPGSCRTWGPSPRRPRVRPATSTRRRAACSSCCSASWNGWPRGPRSSSSSRTCTGRTARRATCSGSWSATCASAAVTMLVLTYRSDELHRRHPLLPFLAELGAARAASSASSCIHSTGASWRPSCAPIAGRDSTPA